MRVDAAVAVRGLRAENHFTALGIDEPEPRLSWHVIAPGEWEQTGYEIELRSDPGAAAVVELTGVVNDSASVYRPWPAAPLGSRQHRIVRVRVFGRDGSPSPWSDPLVVERGLAAGDWVGVPVSPAWPEDPDSDRRPPLLRREFQVPGRVISARVHATAHGVFELEINGRRVGDDTLSPGWTVYDRRLRCFTYDVTDVIEPGANAVGAWVGDGWYRGRLGFSGGNRNLYGSDIALMAQLEIVTDTGERMIVATDGSWRAAPSPIHFSGLYDGERYDARDEQPGWSSSGFDDSDWSPVVLGERDPVTLTAPDGPPVRATQELAPASVVLREPGRTIVDFAQNLVGRIRFSASGAPGTSIRLRHAEVLQDGELYVRPLRTARATDEYVFAGREREAWEARFTYHGFRYAEVTADDATLDSLELTARVYHSDMTRRGWFECSDPLLNRLHENVVWSMRGNFVDLPTDCPQRDERLGWTGDIQVFAPTAAYLFDVSGVLGSWLEDLALEQLGDGTVPWYVPVVPGRAMWTPIRPGAVWGDAAVLTPWDVYEATGDRGILERQWHSARAWVDLLERRAGEGRLWTGDFQLGDWLDPSAPPNDPAKATTDKDLVANAYFARSAQRLSQTAEVLGLAEETRHYARLADDVRVALRGRYLDHEGRLETESQTGYALLIAFDLLADDSQRTMAAARLRSLVQAAGHRIASGFAGTPLVSSALAISGSLDTAYRQLLERECPSWLYTVLQGGTTIWERWDSQRPDGSVNPGQMTSFNHYALGAVADFLHRTVAGLAPLEPGYRRIRFAPKPGGGLSWARTSHLSPYGLVSIEWHIDHDGLRVLTEVPTGATAILELPDGASFELAPGRHEHWASSEDAERDTLPHGVAKVMT